MNHYMEAWRQCLNFTGRATREAFWIFFFVHCLISAVFVFLEIQVGLSWKIDAIYSLAVFLPALAITIRRLHDTNRSAWWLALLLIPAIGMIWLLILLALPSTHDANNDSIAIGEIA
ncbi:DUF805 domain-containing protein [Marinomonas sp. C2222]|uniref:DUF805 domain-containing protein n=1 Tax=Marinomonas sargassi TaxID=2984494 RepID=A0ABT2YUM5_9GAMM|nr:DUF805 domain-containing protein [Marinomonas sargassi]MCV2403597.1 DUF805 domain-containing protein [Marinomonas sargassi]